MTARTAALHDATELLVIFADDRQAIFKAASGSSDASYVVHYDTETQSASCDCPAGIRGINTCWHIDLAGQAYNNELVRQEDEALTIRRVLEMFSTEELVRIGREAAERLNSRTLPFQSELDKLVVRMGRRIWRARRLAEQERTA